jgi:hypothetical protein
MSSVFACVSVGASGGKDDQNRTYDNVLVFVLSAVGIASCILSTVMILMRYKFARLTDFSARAVNGPGPVSSIRPVQRGRVLSSNSLSSYTVDDFSLGVSEYTDELSTDETSSHTIAVFERVRTV